MIKIDKSLLDYNKKIVFAGNGIGKTRSSFYLNDYYKSRNIETQLFTRKIIENLTSANDKKIFLGRYAKEQNELDNINNEIDKGTIISKIMLTSSKISASNLKETSLFCSKLGIKNKKDAKPLKISKRKGEILNKYSYDQILEFDRLLAIDKTLYDTLVEGNDILEKYRVEKNFDFDMSSHVPDWLKKDIYDIYLYSKIFKIKTCLLCGKRYRNNNDLIKHIEQMMNDTKEIEDEDIGKINSWYFTLYKLFKDSDNQIAKDVFEFKNDFKKITPKRKIRDLLVYIKISEAVLSYLNKNLTDYKLNIGEETLSFEEALKRKEKLDHKLKKYKKSASKIKIYNNFVIREAGNLLSLNEEIKLVPLSDAYGIEVKVGKKSVNPYEILSESQIKKLSLIIMKAEIKFFRIKTIILDDPIDSYDDYNKVIACNYIAKLVSSTILENWYIFTNDFECVYNLAPLLNCKTVFILENIDSVYHPNVNDIISEVDSNYIKIIAKNDLYHLKKFTLSTASKYLFDYRIMLCALTLTLRNFKTEIANELTGIDIVNRKSSVKSSWKIKVSNFIEKDCEHYDDQDSDILTVSSVAECFLALHPSSLKSYPKTLSTNQSLFKDFRENTVKSLMMLNNDYRDVVNCLFKKIVLVNYLKYELEKKLVLLVKKTFNESDFEKFKAIKTGLGDRIKGANRINKENGYGIEHSISKISSIHSEYRGIYNLFDHGTFCVLTPYLSTSVNDIRRFKEAIDSI